MWHISYGIHEVLLDFTPPTRLVLWSAVLFFGDKQKPTSIAERCESTVAASLTRQQAAMADIILVSRTELARLLSVDPRSLRKLPAVVAKLLSNHRLTPLYSYPTDLASAAVVVNSSAVAKTD